MKDPYIWFYWLAGITVYTQVMIWLLRAIRGALQTILWVILYLPITDALKGLRKALNDLS